jgi:hypothetical protein
MEKKTWNLLAAILLVLGASGAARFGVAQEPPKPPDEIKLQAFYRLDFVIRELEGDKQVNSRKYTMVAKDRDWGRVRVGSRVPINREGSEIHYQDVGIYIDCSPIARESGIYLNTIFESSSVSAQDASGSPLFHQIRYSGGALAGLGKPTVIAKLDDVVRNRRFELEVTVTEVK